MRNIKQKIVLVIVTAGLFAFIFQSDIGDFFSDDIPGCTDPIALNFNASATEDDGSCNDGTGLSNELLEKIENLKVSDWNTDDYSNLKYEIHAEFSSNNQTGSNAETKAQKNLDLAYMYVLRKATDKEVLNCFKSSLILKEEVKSFYKKADGSSTEIQTAMSWFDKKDQVYSYRNKVRDLLEKEFSQTTFEALENEITDFRTNDFKETLRRCSDLSSIISVYRSDLKKYNGAFRKYKLFTLDYEMDGIEWVEVSTFDIEDFENYKWYHTEIMKIDAEVKERVRRRAELNDTTSSIKGY